MTPLKAKCISVAIKEDQKVFGLSKVIDGKTKYYCEPIDRMSKHIEWAKCYTFNDACKLARKMKCNVDLVEVVNLKLKYLTEQA